MDSQPNLFLIAFLLVSFLVWQTWQTDHVLQSKNVQVITNKSNSLNNEASLDTDTLKKSPKNIITVKTNFFTVDIDRNGGDINCVKLSNYSNKLGSESPLVFLESTPSYMYEAQSGLIGPDGPDNITRPIYNVPQNHFEMESNANILRVPLFWKNSAGIIFFKNFIFRRDEFKIDVEYHIKNTTKKDITISMFGQLQQDVNLPDYRNKNSNNFSLHAFRGVAYSTKHAKYEKYKFHSIMNNKHLKIRTQKGWVAMLEQYFASAWIPRTQGVNTFYTSNKGNRVIIGYKSAIITIKAGKEANLMATLWVGPEIQDKMAHTAPYLDLTVDYGWLWFLSQPLFKLLKLIHSYVNNWGFAIILITIIVRGIMYPLTQAQYSSMAKMRLLQPKIQEIRERYKNDKQRMSQEIMNLYRNARVNPLGGCLPVFIQMPIFLSLYYMLSNSIELRHAPFILWMHDLSSQDPYYILPIIMGMTMFFIQKKSPSTVTDPLQQKIMSCMPIIFTIFFLWFPSGLVLYYIVSNVFTIFQQHFINQSLKKRGLVL